MIKQSLSSDRFQKKIAHFCQLRLQPILEPRAYENVRSYMLGLILFRSNPPAQGDKLSWNEIALACDLKDVLTAEVKRAARPGFDAIVRWPADNAQKDRGSST